MQSIAGSASDNGVRTAAWRIVPLLTVGYIVSYPGVMFYLSTWFPVEVRARVFAWFNVANPMSSAISGPVSAALLKMNGVGGLAGWRWKSLATLNPESCTSPRTL